VKNLNFIIVLLTAAIRSTCVNSKALVVTPWWWHESVETCSSIDYTKDTVI